MLCEAGADIDLGDKQGDHAAITCAHMAPSNCVMMCIALLLTYPPLFLLCLQQQHESSHKLGCTCTCFLHSRPFEALFVPAA